MPWRFHVKYFFCFFILPLLLPKVLSCCHRRQSSNLSWCRSDLSFLPVTSGLDDNSYGDRLWLRPLFYFPSEGDFLFSLFVYSFYRFARYPTSFSFLKLLEAFFLFVAHQFFLLEPEADKECRNIYKTEGEESCGTIYGQHWCSAMLLTEAIFIWNILAKSFK